MATRKRRRNQLKPLAAVTDMLTFGLDCQEVVGRRLARIAKGDAAALLEAQRMVTEKMMAAAEANFAIMGAWMLGPEIAMARALVPFEKAVRANRRRLRGRSSR